MGRERECWEKRVVEGNAREEEAMETKSEKEENDMKCKRGARRRAGGIGRSRRGAKEGGEVAKE
jgi:hypothetical protein